MTPSWKAVWEGRRQDDPSPSVKSELARLMDADGFNTGFGSMTEASWSAFVRRICNTLHIVPGDTICEVGCGSGAFLYLPYTDGIHVGGIDYSQALIERARLVMPGGQFAAEEASALSVTPAVDFVTSCSVFLYFSSLDYARDVIGRMAKKATCGVAILDVPDVTRASEALELRQSRFGGAAAYNEHYEGLGHQAYDRQWMIDALEDAGLADVRVEDQDIDGYENSRFRFNAFASVPAQQT